MGVSNEFSLVSREVLEHESSQVSVFTKIQQILQVKRVDAVLRVVVDDLVRHEQWLVGVGRAESVHRETTGKTGDRPEERFESLGKVVRDEVLVDLRHCNDRLLRVGDRRFSADTDDLLVVHHSVISTAQ